MITERDIRNAIDECHAVENPTADTCRKLASYYIIQDHMHNDDNIADNGYSGASDAVPLLDSGTEFSEAIKNREISEILPIIDEMLTVIQTINPRLYDGVMRRIEE